jgi:hypothetical protein
VRKYKIILILALILIFIGLGQINLNLNRQIYSSIAGDSNYKSTVNNEHSWNLDHMEDILTYPENYNIGGRNGDEEGMANVPKVRILFNNKPFDFRIDTDKYVFFINSNVIENINNRFNNLIDNFRKKTVKVWNVLES